uniref:Uncharacterized protein n=1 Tax=uncultured bacterium fosmid pJB135F11 TaxID=1478051 RepID=A0A0H3UA83_9BACT|nr:hypothetical protein [uncultured bacterium fosmid pJB135F11]
MKKVINSILAVCVLLLLFICWRSIQDDQDFNAEVAYRESVVKARLLQIRAAEEAYKAQHPDAEYCSDWNVLIGFVKDGKLPIVTKQGVLTDKQMEDGLTEASAAAIVNSGDQAAIAAKGLENFRRDTVWVSLKDSLYKEEGFEPDSLRYIPFAMGDTFELIACPNTTRSGAIIHVMECNAPDSSFLKGLGKQGKRFIYNRQEEADAKGAFPGLRIGDAGNNWNNNAGNWE